MHCKFDKQNQRLLVALGGGGKRGIEALLEVEVDEDWDDPSRVVSPVVLLRPGMLMEKVWPSFKV